MKNADVIVVGGGLAGLSLTALLGTHGIKVLCLDRDAQTTAMQQNFDGRTTAISFGSRKVLAAAGVWDFLAQDCCAIDNIQILDGDSPVLLEFDCSEVGGRTFGWIAENRMIRKALYDKIKTLKTAEVIAPAVVADYAVSDDQASVILADGRSFDTKLIVGADGRFSFTREWMGIGARDWSYRQRAIVCTVTHENPHDNIAVENFRPEGPFAILPMTDDENGNHRSSVVWTEHGQERNSPIHYGQQAFDAALQARFPARYGAVKQIHKRFTYPLGLIHAHDYVAPRMALVADAAHGIHPIAGQGLNLGFRDIASLSALIVEAIEQDKDPGGETLLNTYQRARRVDNMMMAGATDTLNRLFSNDITPVRMARKAGLKMVSNLPFAKQFFMKQAMGAAGLLPALIRDREAA